ncbi:hypothetical protein CN326_21320 [Bacillus sp. AFS018417]|nr:hypothetical protein CN326_21320 [Bacillus sp. AFS018417]
MKATLIGDFKMVFIYPVLTSSKTPTSRFRESKEDRWGITASKSPIGSTNHHNKKAIFSDCLLH